jgi:hypothetical protein
MSTRFTIFPAAAPGLILLLGLACVAMPVSAEEETEENSRRRGVSNRFLVAVGAYVVNFDTQARLDSSEGDIGTGIDLEDDLNLNRDQIDLRMDGVYRLGQRSRLDFGYLFLGRDSFNVLEEAIEYGDINFDVGAEVATRFDTEVIRFGYNYAFVDRPRVVAGFTAGLSTFIFDLGLFGEGTIDGEEDGAEGELVFEAQDLIAPVPMLGLHLVYSIAPRLAFRTQAYAFYLNTDDWVAQLSELKLGLDYYAWKNVGVGLGYDLVNMSYTDEDDAKEFKVSYKYDGLMAYVSFYF